MRRSWLHSITCVWTAASIAVTGCHAPAPSTVKPRPTPPAVIPEVAGSGRATVPLITGAADGALAIRAIADVEPLANDAPVSVLPAAATEALLARLEPLPRPSTVPAPAIRPPSAAPGRTGSPVTPIVFVAPGGTAIPEAPLGAPTQVVLPLAAPEILPTGEVRPDSELRVSFDEPIVAVAAVGTEAAPPATIAPPVAGTWRWIDTRVASFTTAVARFPAASTYTVTVPAGTRAVAGGVLAAAQTATFTTPPVRIAGAFPSTELRPDSPIVVELDQDIDPAAVLRFLRVEVGKTAIPIRSITLDEARALWGMHPGIVFDPARLAPHHLIVAPRTAWPAGAEARIVLGKGAPSREGPRVTVEETEARFTVIAPFVVRGITCNDDERPRTAGVVCPARGYVTVELSNPIAKASYRAPQIQIEGEPAAHTEPSTYAAGSVMLSVPEAVGRTYTIAIAEDLTDVHGQRLGGPRRLTFTTKPERFDPYLRGVSGLFVLDPRFEIPQWVIATQAIASLRVELYQVQPADYFAFQAFEAGTRATPPGKRVVVKQHPIGARFEATARVDLRPALGAAGTGHLIAVATATPSAAGAVLPRRLAAWIQVSKLGMTARLDGDRASAWVHQIAPASQLEPIAGVQASLVVEGRGDAPAVVATDAQGHAELALPPPRPPAKHAHEPGALLVARTATDSVFGAIDGNHEKAVRVHQARWYVTDDRFTYKPGETVYVKGWVRWSHDGVNPDLALPARGDAVAYTVVDARGGKLASGTAPLTDQGGFDLEVALPANANLGTASIELATRKESYSHPIAIEEYRRPTFSVELDDDAGATPVIAGEVVEMTASAKYYGGGSLAGAGVKWTGALTGAAYRPPGWDTFGFDPVRTRAEAYRSRYRRNGTRSRTTTELTATSASTVSIAIAATPSGEPAVLSVETAITDVDRATVRTSSRSILVHPSGYYVGIRRHAMLPGTLELIVTDLDGAAVSGVPIAVTIEGVAADDRDTDDAKVIDTQRCAVASATRAVTCPWRPRDDRTVYTAVARVADARGRPAAAQLRIPWWPPAAYDTPPDLEITADRDQYRPGEVAKLQIRSAVVPATAVVSVARQGVIRQHRLELAAASTPFELPIDAAYRQNVHVVVDRWARRDRAKLPEHVSASRALRVDIEGARLAMTARATRPVVEPGEQATFEVTVRHGDRPVAGAEVALLVVDEAVLALSAKTHGDPLAPFYFDVDQGTSATSTLALVNDAGDDLAGKPGFERWNLDDPDRAGHGRGMLRGRTAAVPTVSIGSANMLGKARRDFRGTAVFAPRLVTDARGVATVSLAMPDSLTRFRIVALATASTHHFGKAEGSIATRRPLNARIVAPRFLTQGDAFALPVVVQNLDAAPRTIDVAVRAANLVAAGPSGKRVTVGAGQRAELRFDFATRSRGTAVLQAIAVSAGAADATTIELPVYEPATTESFATYGTVDDQPRFEQLAVPADIFPDVGGVEAELASTQLQSLTDAFGYLEAYPFECAEQRSSRMLATSAMADVLDAFATPGRPTRAERTARYAKDLARLAEAQNYDDGWGYFPGMKSDPYVTIQVLAALAAHKDTSTTTERAVRHVTQLATALLARLDKLARTPAAERKLADAPSSARDVALAAAALGSLAETGASVRARAERLDAVATALGPYPVDARARVLALLARSEHAKAIRGRLLAELLSSTRETAAAATVTASYTDAERALLVSPVKTTALVLDAILREAPDHPLVGKLARGLLDGRRGGRWISTQDNLTALRALRRYFDVHDKAAPSYTGKLWLGTAAYAEQPFVGRSTRTAVARLDWTALAPGSSHDVALARTAGPGRMYYRIGITYAPKRIDLPPLDAGFIVRRSYEAVDDPDDVVRTPDGRYRVRLGAKVLVTLETVTTARRHGVALVDPLPAGFEPINPSLATSELAPRAGLQWDHVNRRDNRSEAFSMALPPGRHHFTYTARATTPGTFLAAPAKAEEMYSPETFGRSSGTTVVIE